MFEKSIGNPKGGVPFVSNDFLNPDSLRFLEDLWSWVVSGFVVIPCEVDSASTNRSILLKPKLQPNKGGSGYAHLLPFSFIVPSVFSGGAGGVTIAVSNGSQYQTARPVYYGQSAIDTTDLVSGQLCVAFAADESGSLPDRFAILK